VVLLERPKDFDSRSVSLVPGRVWAEAKRGGRAVDAATVIRELWTRTQARDWAGIGELVADDAVIEWPVSCERIVGRSNYITINREYPERWEIWVLRVIGSGDEAASEVEVAHGTMGMFRAASFWTVRDGKIARGTEYWTNPGSEQGMAERAAYVEPM
jgi:ketosteroid isomerase-like protein